MTIAILPTPSHMMSQPIGAAMPPSPQPPDEQANAVEIDARGLLCPLPVLRLRKRLMTLTSGTIVRLITTDPAAIIDVPHFCAETGHRLLSSGKRDDGSQEFIVICAPR